MKILNNGSKSSKSKASGKSELTREKSHDAFTSFEKIMVDRIVQTEIALDTSRRYRFIEIRQSINFRIRYAFYSSVHIVL